jgi:hypothetical protein
MRKQSVQRLSQRRSAAMLAAGERTCVAGFECGGSGGGVLLLNVDERVRGGAPPDRCPSTRCRRPSSPAHRRRVANAAEGSRGPCLEAAMSAARWNEWPSSGRSSCATSSRQMPKGGV